MITNEHIEQYLAQAHRYGDAKLMLCKFGTQEPVPETSASSPILHERLPLLHNINL